MNVKWSSGFAKVQTQNDLQDQHVHGLTGPLCVSASFNCNLFEVNIKTCWFGGPATVEINWSCPKITGPGPTDRWLTKPPVKVIVLGGQFSPPMKVIVLGGQFSQPVFSSICWYLPVNMAGMEKTDICRHFANLETRLPQYQCTYRVWWKSIDIHLSYHTETKIWTDVRQTDGQQMTNWQHENITCGCL